jgi:hypothetical protein
VALLAAGFNSSQRASIQTPVAQTITSTRAEPAVTAAPTATPSSTISNIPTGWKTHTDSTGAFQISYPADWKAFDIPEGKSYSLPAEQFVLSAPTDDGWRTVVRFYPEPMTQVANAIVASFDFYSGKPTSSSQTITRSGNDWIELDVTYFNPPGSGLPATSQFETLLLEEGSSTYEFSGDYNGSDPQYGSIDRCIFNSFVVTKWF